MKFKHTVIRQLCLSGGVFVSIGIAWLAGMSEPSGWGVKHPAANLDDDIFIKTGTVKSADVVESSGLGFSFRRPNLIWTINDSGHGTEIYGLDLEGNLVAEVTVSGAENIDWEAMSSVKRESNSYLVVADVGDNSFRRESYQLYIVPEPDLQQAAKPQTAQARRISFSYEDGSKNCEAMAVEPVSGEIWLVEKVYYDSRQEKPPGIYVLPWPAAGEQGRPVKRIADFPVRNVTGMAFSPDGKQLIIRNYTNAYYFVRSPDVSWQATITNHKPVPIPLPLQRQGEAICFTPDSQSLIVTSEYRRQAIWKIDLKKYLKMKSDESNPQPNSDVEQNKSATPTSTSVDSGAVT